MTQAPVSPPVSEPGTVPSDTGGDIGDHFRHIICVRCHPAFENVRAAPHDAHFICGRLIRRGQAPSPPSFPQCILCNEMWEEHRATAHPGS